MSKATQQANATASGSSGGGDQDIAHDPDVARRTSRAGLKQAEAASLTSSSDEARKEQRDNSKQLNIEGYQAAIMAAAKQIVDHATRVETLAHASTTEAGNEPLRQAIEAGAATVSARVFELEMNVSGAKNAGMDARSLQHPMAVFDRACTQFVNAATGAGHAASGAFHGLSEDTKGRMNSLCHAVGLPADASKYPVVSTEMSTLHGTKQAVMDASATTSMLRAASESIRLARMTMTVVKNDVRIQDFKRAAANVRELAVLIATDDRAKHQHRAQLIAVVRDARSMFAEARVAPLEREPDATVDASRKAEFAQMIAPGGGAEISIGKIEAAVK